MRLRHGDSPRSWLWGRLAKVSPEVRRGMGDKGLGRGEEASRGKVLIFLESTQIGAKGDKGHVREKVIITVKNFGDLTLEVWAARLGALWKLRGLSADKDVD